MLAHALHEGFDVHAMTFRYGQRHASRDRGGAARGHGVRRARPRRRRHRPAHLRRVGADADIDVPKDRDARRRVARDSDHVRAGAQHDLPVVRLAWAEVLGAPDIFIGVNALDYSGYPDCRPEYIAAFERMANLATRGGVEGTAPMRIQTPLIDLTKREIIRLGLSLGVDYSMTLSCYDPAPRGEACGHCDACQLRLAASPRQAGPAPYATRLTVCTRLRRSSTRSRAKARTPAVPAVFCRFSGCNLWTGAKRTARRPSASSATRTSWAWAPTAASSRRRTRLPTRWRRAGRAAKRRRSGWWCAPAASRCCSSMRRRSTRSTRRGFERRGGDERHAVEPPAGIDWICVSPKANAPLVLTAGDELKLVYPQAGADPERFAGLDFDNFFLQPMDGPDARENTRKAVEFCLAHPLWRLSLQTHKLLGLR